jgi:hypothetical protein
VAQNLAIVLRRVQTGRALAKELAPGEELLVDFQAGHQADLGVIDAFGGWFQGRSPGAPRASRPQGAPIVATSSAQLKRSLALGGDFWPDEAMGDSGKQSALIFFVVVLLIAAGVGVVLM